MVVQFEDLLQAENKVSLDDEYDLEAFYRSWDDGKVLDPQFTDSAATDAAEEPGGPDAEEDAFGRVEPTTGKSEPGQESGSCGAEDAATPDSSHRARSSSSTDGAGVDEQDDPAFIVPDVTLYPFPIDVLPSPWREYAVANANGLNVPVEAVAGPLLIGCGALMGRSRSLTIGTWSNFASDWMALVGAPGSTKSGAIDAAIKPIHDMQERLHFEFVERLKKWADGGTDEDEPNRRIVVTTDATAEAITRDLTHSPGVLVHKDELSGFVSAMNKYKNSGDDGQFYLTAWSQGPASVSRKGAEHLYIRKMAVGVVGGIQPDVMPQLALQNGVRDGFLDRFLYVALPVRDMEWRDEDEDGALDAAVSTSMNMLGDCVVDDAEYRLTPEAHRLWKAYHKALNQVLSKHPTADSYVRKFPTHVARLALALAAMADPNATLGRQIDSNVLDSAIRLGWYFLGQFLRILPLFGNAYRTIADSKPSSARERILKALEDGDWHRKTHVTRAINGAVPGDAIDAELDMLLAEGIIERKQAETEGRPGPRAVLWRLKV